ncbi:tyrosine aminotransferase-like [Xenia sp. Carnegie-2017]|uniref:tyrosine aminotransferase-like n=1 Tax=Xenia sp. Carnegie-2017 TaxID=2897299 RepID=UPI001F03B225|nr:tyrosine aminotransferase-like [Xenia sp. Carnegie-2017]
MVIMCLYVTKKKRTKRRLTNRGSQKSFETNRAKQDGKLNVARREWLEVNTFGGGINEGDPTVFGNLPPSEECVRALCDAIKSGKDNCYKPAHECKEAQNAVAKYSPTPEYIVDAEDVVLASGCSGAIEIALNALVDRGDNILIPKPGFSLYKCTCGSRKIKTRFYKLIPENGWEVDLDDMASLINERTKLIVVVNPSNPCVSVYKREHLEEILNIAEKYRVPVLCDEVYAHVTFAKEPFHSMGSLTKNVPVLVVGGIAKR